MNVLFLTHAFPRAVGDPAGSFVLRLAVALSAHGVSPTVIAPHAPGLAEQELIQGIPVWRFRYAPERYETLAYAGTMADQVRASWGARLALGGLVAAAMAATDRGRRHLHPRLLHAHWWFPSGLAAAPVAWFRRIPLVTTLHGSDVRLTQAVQPARFTYAHVARRSARVTAVSSWLASVAHGLAPQSPAPFVAPMPADVGLFSPGGTRAPDRLLFVGRLTPQKGVELLLRALADLPGSVSLDIVGDGPAAAALRTLSSALGIAARVRWHATAPQQDLVHFYRSATALVVPSVEEGLGLVAVEAQLCETPVVAFDSGGLRDVVTDGETGLLARPVSAQALTTALAGLFNRPDRGAALGRSGRARALERFAPDSTARVYTAIYEEAIAHFHDR